MTAKITNMNPRPLELVNNMRAGALHSEARDKKIPVLRLLENMYPTKEDEDHLPPLSRMLAELKLPVSTDMAEGVYASEVSAFEKSDGTRFLLHTLMTQAWEDAINPRKPTLQSARPAGDVDGRGLYEIGDQIIGSPMQPWVMESVPRQPLIAPQIPLEALIAITTPITGSAYQTFYITDDKPNQRLTRIGQGAELPRAKITGSPHTIQLHKYGRAIEFTYELLRRQRIDLVALHVQRIAVQAESDRVAAAMAVLVSGDGNANTAATSYNLTALDPAATAGTLTLKGWLSFKLKFPNPYIMTTALANEAVILQLELLNTGTANIPLVYLQGASRLGSFDLINPQLRDAVSIGISADAPSLTIVAFDSRLGLQRITEVGGDITETERFISRQTELLAISYVDAYAVFDQNAARVLNVNA